MILYFGEENATSRFVKMNWLKAKFAENTMSPIHSLAGGALNDNRSFFQKLTGTKEKIIISGHGNADEFMDRTATELYNYLVSKGLNDERFDKLYLLGCDLGAAAQDNSITQNVLRDFGRAVKTGGAAPNLKVYGPRGRVSWTISSKTESLLTTYTVDDVRIKVKRAVDNVVLEDYSFDAGLLLYSQ